MKYLLFIFLKCPLPNRQVIRLSIVECIFKNMYWCIFPETENNKTFQQSHGGPL